MDSRESEGIHHYLRFPDDLKGTQVLNIQSARSCISIPEIMLKQYVSGIVLFWTYRSYDNGGVSYVLYITIGIGSCVPQLRSEVTHLKTAVAPGREVNP